jgi:hypothetical protein
MKNNKKFVYYKITIGANMTIMNPLNNAGLIDVRLFTALVAAASFTAITVPLGFALLIRRWGEQLTTLQSDIM